MSDISKTWLEVIAGVNITDDEFHSGCKNILSVLNFQGCQVTSLAQKESTIKCPKTGNCCKSHQSKTLYGKICAQEPYKRPLHLVPKLD